MTRIELFRFQCSDAFVPKLSRMATVRSTLHGRGGTLSETSWDIAIGADDSATLRAKPHLTTLLRGLGTAQPVFTTAAALLPARNACRLSRSTCDRAH